MNAPGDGLERISYGHAINVERGDLNFYFEQYNLHFFHCVTEIPRGVRNRLLVESLRPSRSTPASASTKSAISKTSDSCQNSFTNEHDALWIISRFSTVSATIFVENTRQFTLFHKFSSDLYQQITQLYTRFNLHIFSINFVRFFNAYTNVLQRRMKTWRD